MLRPARLRRSCNRLGMVTCYIHGSVSYRNVAQDWCSSAESTSLYRPGFRSRGELIHQGFVDGLVHMRATLPTRLAFVNPGQQVKAVMVPARSIVPSQA